MNLTHSLPGDLLSRPIRIHVAGCGGNGSHMLSGLARLDRAIRECGHPGGISVIAWDPDHVSGANIGRQLFAPSDLGHNKAAVLVTRLNAFWNLRWDAVDQEWDAQPIHRPFAAGMSTVEYPDILISCVDTARARRGMHQALTGSHSRLTYWLDLGNLQRTGQVVLGEPDTAWRRNNPRPRLPTVTELHPELLDENYKEDNRPSCSVAEALESQSLFINDWMSREALEMLERMFRFGKIDYHAVYVNREDGEHPRVPIPNPVSARADNPKRRRTA